MKIYLASSWRNPGQPAAVLALRAAGHEVYDFRNPRVDDHGFAWARIDPAWEEWSADRFRAALAHPVAVRGYGFDRAAMEWADACVLLLPCGCDAHLEFGWCAGAGKLTIALLADPPSPGLMLKVADHLCVSMAEVLSVLALGVSR